MLTDGTDTYLYGHDRLRALGGPWYIGDALGSVRQTLDDAGAVVGSVQYDPWGVPTAGTPQPFGFTGELHSAGQVYLRARWYAPGNGTFTSRDPFAGWSKRPDSLQPYIYAGNDPVRYTDPSGHYRVDLQKNMLVVTTFEEARQFDRLLGHDHTGIIAELQAKRRRERIGIGLLGGAAVGACTAGVGLAVAGLTLTGAGVTTAVGGIGGAASTMTGFVDDLGIDPNETLRTLTFFQLLDQELFEYHNSGEIGDGLKIWASGSIADRPMPLSLVGSPVLIPNMIDVLVDPDQAEALARGHISTPRVPVVAPMKHEILMHIQWNAEKFPVDPQQVGLEFFVRWRDLLRSLAADQDLYHYH